MSYLAHQFRLYKDITRHRKPLLHDTLVALSCDYLLCRDENLRNKTSKTTVFDFGVNILLNLGFFSTYGTQYVPFHFYFSHNEYLVLVDKIHDPLEKFIFRKNHNCNENGSN